MKIRPRARLAAALSALAVALTALASPQTAHGAPALQSVPYADYLSTAGTGAVSSAGQAANADQCGLAVSQRIGAWTCNAPIRRNPLP
jgi:hypothetical protein